MDINQEAKAVARYMAEGDPSEREYLKGFAIGMIVAKWDGDAFSNVDRQHMLSEKVDECFDDVLAQVKREQEEFEAKFTNWECENRDILQKAYDKLRRRQPAPNSWNTWRDSIDKVISKFKLDGV